jgi:hypothetical protein
MNSSAQNTFNASVDWLTATVAATVTAQWNSTQNSYDSSGDRVNGTCTNEDVPFVIRLFKATRSR